MRSSWRVFSWLLITSNSCKPCATLARKVHIITCEVAVEPHWSLQGHLCLGLDTTCISALVQISPTKQDRCIEYQINQSCSTVTSAARSAEFTSMHVGLLERQIIWYVASHNIPC